MKLIKDMIWLMVFTGILGAAITTVLLAGG